MFPFFIQWTAEEETSDDPVAFLIGRNGSFIRKRTAVFEAVVPSPDLPMLEEIKERGSYLLPPIPAWQAAQILGFFREVFQKHQTEAILLISYNSVRKTFRLDAPVQRNTGGHCNYEMPAEPADGFEFVGTVHSHGSMSAFHSGTDQHDEQFFDGVHLTFGHVTDDYIDIVASLAVSGRRFTLDPSRVLAGTEKRQAPPPPPAPVAIIQTAPVVTQPQPRFRGFRPLRRFLPKRWAGKQPPVAATEAAGPRPIGFQPPGAYYPTWQHYAPRPKEGYVIDPDPEVTPEEHLPDPSWMEQVQQHTYAAAPVAYVSDETDDDPRGMAEWLASRYPVDKAKDEEGGE